MTTSEYYNNGTNCRFTIRTTFLYKIIVFLRIRKLIKIESGNLHGFYEGNGLDSVII